MRTRSPIAPEFVEHGRRVAFTCRADDLLACAVLGTFGQSTALTKFSGTVQPAFRLSLPTVLPSKHERPHQHEEHQSCKGGLEQRAVLESGHDRPSGLVGGGRYGCVGIHGLISTVTVSMGVSAPGSRAEMWS